MPHDFASYCSMPPQEEQRYRFVYMDDWQQRFAEVYQVARRDGGRRDSRRRGEYLHG